MKTAHRVALAVLALALLAFGTGCPPDNRAGVHAVEPAQAP